MAYFKIDQDEIIDFLKDEGFIVSRNNEELFNEIFDRGLIREFIENIPTEDIIIFLENSGYTVTWNNDNTKDISEEHKLLLWKLYDEMKLSTPEQFIQIVDKILQKEIQKWL